MLQLGTVAFLQLFTASQRDQDNGLLCKHIVHLNKKLSYSGGTARRAMSRMQLKSCQPLHTCTKIAFEKTATMNDLRRGSTLRQEGSNCPLPHKLRSCSQIFWLQQC